MLSFNSKSPSMFAQLAILFRWWGKELATLVPTFIKKFFQVDAYQIRLNFAAEKVTLLDTSKANTLEQFRLDPHSPVLPAGLISALKKLNTTRVDTVLILDPEDVLFLDLNLPSEAESNLHNILGYEMDRQTPFTIDQVYYDYLVNKLPDDARHIQVKLAVARRELVKNWLEQIKNQGLFPAVVTVLPNIQDDNSQLSDINLLPNEMRPIRSRTVARLNYLFLVMAFIMLVVMTVTILFRQNTYIEYLSEEISSVSDEVQQVQQLRQQINNLVEHSNWILERKRQSASIIATLNDLSIMIPDTTWLNKFELHGDRLRLQGESVNASELIGLIESYANFSNATFTSPVVRDAKTGRERFQIIAKLSVQDDAS